jgi:hypothetical protein
MCACSTAGCIRFARPVARISPVSTYRTTRGKIVSRGQVRLAVDDDGVLHIHVGNQGMLLSEADASAFHDLMSDVLEWESNRGTTEGKFDRMSDAEEADIDSGRHEDDRAHMGR